VICEVPGAVLEIARVLPVGKDVADRLLSDARMASVWRELGRRVAQLVRTEPKPEPCAGAAYATAIEARLARLDPYRRLDAWELSPVTSTAEQGAGWATADSACAAIFAFAVVEFSSKRSATTSTEVENAKGKWEAAAALLQTFAKSAPMRPAIGFEKMALQRSADFIREQIQLLEQRGDSPYVVGAQKTDLRTEARGQRAEVKGQVRALVRDIEQLLGTSMRGTAATIANVALDIPDGSGQVITAKDIENWTRHSPKVGSKSSEIDN
jgi:hypothetical protein